MGCKLGGYFINTYIQSAMRINLGSMAFGFFIEKGGGTPAWGTELGQSKPSYKFTVEGCEEVLIGMLYNSVNLHSVSLPLGKGGRVDLASNFEECHLAALFQNVYINGLKIDHPFLMVMIKELSASHSGRRTIKYSDKISCNVGGKIIGNLNFFKFARKALGLNDESCWFVYDISVRNLDELHFRAVIVNSEFSEYYTDSTERKEHWLSLI